VALNEDEWAVCPGCDHDCLAYELCEHDDAVTGPLCLTRCCEISHPVGRPPWAA
jgi:hypothetical protein